MNKLVISLLVLLSVAAVNSKNGVTVSTATKFSGSTVNSSKWNGVNIKATGGSYTNPFSVSGMLVWYKTDTNAMFIDDGITLATNLQEVYRWNDSSGNNNHIRALNSSHRPDLREAPDGTQKNGVPVLRFLTSEYLTNKLFAANGLNTGTAFAIVRVGSLGGYNGIFSAESGVVNGLYKKNTDKLSISSTTELDNPTTSPANTWVHVTAVFNGASSQLYTNGVLAASGTATSAGTMTNIIVGNLSGKGSGWGLMSELFIYTNVLSNGNLTNTWSYITNKYGAF